MYKKWIALALLAVMVAAFSCGQETEIVEPEIEVPVSRAVIEDLADGYITEESGLEILSSPEAIQWFKDVYIPLPGNIRIGDEVYAPWRDQEGEVMLTSGPPTTVDFGDPWWSKVQCNGGYTMSRSNKDGADTWLGKACDGEFTAPPVRIVFCYPDTVFDGYDTWTVIGPDTVVEFSGKLLSKMEDCQSNGPEDDECVLEYYGYGQDADGLYLGWAVACEGLGEIPLSIDTCYEDGASGWYIGYLYYPQGRTRVLSTSSGMAAFKGQYHSWYDYDDDCDCDLADYNALIDEFDPDPVPLGEYNNFLNQYNEYVCDTIVWGYYYP